MLNTNNWIIIGAIAAYMLMMIVIGAVISKKNKTTDDFYLGGRKLGPLVTAMSAEASDMSAYLLMGLPGCALLTGCAEAVWTAIGLSVGTYLNWLFVAKRIRKYSESIDATTIPAFFSKRFGDKKHILSIISALIIIIFFIPYVASGFSACGKLFSSMFGMDYTLAMVISAAVIVIYCTLGGFLAVSTTDLIQGIIMTFALLMVLGISEGIVGGFGNAFSSVSNLDGYTDIFKGYNIFSKSTGNYGTIPIISTLAWGLGYFGMPHVLLRFMAIRDPKELKTSRRIASIWAAVAMGVAILIGIVGYSLIQNGIIADFTTQANLDADGAKSVAEAVIVNISKYISTRGYIPALIAGVFVSGILASTMSTADSQLIAASSSVTKDMLVDTFGVKLSAKSQMWIARISVILISCIGVCLALDEKSSVFEIVSFAWAGFGAAFGPVIIMALFWKRTNKWGALAGMISGGAMIFIWKFIISKVCAGTVLDIYELLPSFILALIVIVIVSLITKKPDAEITETFDTVKAQLND